MFKSDIKQFLLGIIMVFCFALTKNTIIIYIYFAILFLQELKYMSKFQNKRIIQQILMLIPLMGITVVDGVPLGNIYIALFAIYLLFIYKQVGMKKNKFIPYIVFVYFDVLRLFIFYGEGFNFVGLISVPILYLCIFVGIAAFEETNEDEITKFYIPAFIQGVILSVLYGAITRTKSGGITNVLVNTSIMNRNEGASGDPNYFGLYICLAVAMIIFLMIIENRYSTIYFLGTCLLLVMGLSSSSRMFFLLAIFLTNVLCLILFKNMFSKKVITTFVIFIILGFSLYFIQDILMDNIKYVFSRLNTSNINELTNGRSELIQSYMSYISDNIFRTYLGIGIAQYNIRSGIGAYAHNMYLELYVTVGVIGILILIFYFFTNIVQGKFYGKKICQFIPMFIVLISGTSINFLEVDCFYTLLGLIFAIISIQKEEKQYYEYFWMDDHKLNTKYRR